jgi:hypothetical protein
MWQQSMQTDRTIDTNTLLAIALVKIQDIQKRRTKDAETKGDKQGAIVSS